MFKRPAGGGPTEAPGAPSQKPTYEQAKELGRQATQQARFFRDARRSHGNEPGQAPARKSLFN